MPWCTSQVDHHWYQTTVVFYKQTNMQTNKRKTIEDPLSYSTCIVNSKQLLAHLYSQIRLVRIWETIFEIKKIMMPTHWWIFHWLAGSLSLICYDGVEPYTVTRYALLSNVCNGWRIKLWQIYYNIGPTSCFYQIIYRSWRCREDHLVPTYNIGAYFSSINS